MDEDRLSHQFEANRPRLRALTYQMLGSYEDAEDAVQETWFRVVRADSTDVENFGGWLTTISTRICLDKLRARKSRPENPIKAFPADERSNFDEAPGPEQEVLIAESIESALLVVLDHLVPAERVAFVLHDVFAVPFDEILDRTPEATRQLASRARRRVQGTSPSGTTDFVHRREIVAAFIAASRSGDVSALLTVLDPEVLLRPDADAVRLGSFAETRGATAVAQLLRCGAQTARLALVGGMPGLAWTPGGRIRGAVTFDIVNDRIVAINVIGNAEHLDQLDVRHLSQSHRELSTRHKDHH